MRGLVLGVVLAATACVVQETPELGSRSSALNGVPTNGYPSYAERLTLVAINRARSDPNNPALQTAGKGCATACPAAGSGRSDCYTQFPAQKPLMYSYESSRAGRFHCQNLQKMNFGLSHSSPCTLRTDIGATDCDGSETCACASNGHANQCSNLWEGGTDPWARCSYFGFAASGEVGAAGYGNAWDAVYGWVGECANYEGHRKILTSASYNLTGCGASTQTSPATCWSRYYFCDPGNKSGLVTATLPAGAHKPETGNASTSFDFYVNYYSTSGAPQSVQLVLDGACHAMTLEVGTAGNATYKVSRALGDTACHRYWFLARDGAGARAVWPEQGSWGVGSCTDYVATAAPASCEACVPGAACTNADGCQAGTRSCPAGTCDGLANVANGTACGTNKVCSAGACTACTAGGACASADNCKTGTIGCSTGQPVCGGLTNRANGFVCGTNQVCSGGVCTACTAGGACSSADGCRTGTLSCASGAPVCANLINVANGTSCAAGVCRDGVCGAPLDAGVSGPDATLPGPDAATSERDAAQPGPDATTSQPGLDATTSQRDAAQTSPDAATPRADGAVEPDGDAAVANVDGAVVGSDAAWTPETVQSGCGCASTGGAPPWFGLALLLGMWRMRRVA